MSDARLVQALALLALAGGAVIYRLVRGNRAEPAAEDEVAALTPDIRGRLTALRVEPRSWDLDIDNDDQPLSRKAIARLDAALDSLIDDILSEPDGPLEAADVAGRLGVGLATLRKTSPAATALAWGRMIEVWYVLGFRSATGYFAHDPASLPRGRGEPLPPGWTTTERPRPVRPPEPGTDH